MTLFRFLGRIQGHICHSCATKTVYLAFRIVSRVVQCSEEVMHSRPENGSPHAAKEQNLFI